MARFFYFNFSETFNLNNAQYFETHLKHQEIQLPETIVQHLRARRTKLGEQLKIFDGSGWEVSGRLTQLERRSARMLLENYETVSRESPLSIHLIQAISSSERMDFTLQKAVELGVNSISPVYSEHCAPLAKDRIDSRMLHWQAVIISACEQCGRTLIPKLFLPKPWQEIEAKDDHEMRLILSPYAQKSLRDYETPQGKISILIGPEGGFSKEELECARHQDWQEIRLGSRILRTETAAISTLSALQTLWGDF